MASIPIQLLIVDDQAIVREGVKRILAAAPEVCVAEASSSAEAIALLRRTPCDVVLLDLARPEVSGLTTLRAIQDHHPAPVLVLGIYAQERGALDLLKAGARGYLEHGDALEELIDAIHRVAEGGYYIGSALTKRLSREQAYPAPLPGI
jgi:two-component system invasion response regulator UvrY